MHILMLHYLKQRTTVIHNTRHLTNQEKKCSRVVISHKALIEELTSRPQTKSSST